LDLPRTLYRDMVILKPFLKPADVERMLACGEIDPDTSWELVDGEIVYLSPTNRQHARVVGALAAGLWEFSRLINAELLVGDPGFIVGERGQQLRGPDLAIVTRERLTIFREGRAFGAEAPDLAIEVLAPEQHGEAYARPKVAEYLAAGAKVVWLVDPDSRTIRVYEAGAEQYAIYPAGSEITLEAIAPGFSAPVASFFP
jgi:Uma2 family endonuclease